MGDGRTGAGIRIVDDDEISWHSEASHMIVNLLYQYSEKLWLELIRLTNVNYADARPPLISYLCDTDFPGLGCAFLKTLKTGFLHRLSKYLDSQSFVLLVSPSLVTVFGKAFQ